MVGRVPCVPHSPFSESLVFQVPDGVSPVILDWLAAPEKGVGKMPPPVLLRETEEALAILCRGGVTEVARAVCPCGPVTPTADSVPWRPSSSSERSPWSNARVVRVAAARSPWSSHNYANRGVRVRLPRYQGAHRGWQEFDGRRLAGQETYDADADDWPSWLPRLTPAYRLASALQDRVHWPGTQSPRQISATARARPRRGP